MAFSNHAYTEAGNGRIITDCAKCGYTYETHKRYMTDDRPTEWWLCKSCKAVPMTHIRYGNDICYPWQGDFDDDLLICLDRDGNPYKVGPRTCGHADCVKSTHLVAVDEPVSASQRQ